MKLRCVSNRASDLGESQRGRGTQSNGVYDITVGKSYHVAGMVLWETMLWLLVRSDDGSPLNAPAGLFERAPVRLPPEWHFTVGPGARLSGSALWADPDVATWGYPELVDSEFLERLFDGGPDELETFSRYLDDQTDDEKSDSGMV